MITCNSCGRVSTEPENNDPYKAECPHCGELYESEHYSDREVTIDSYSGTLNAQDQKHRNLVRKAHRAKRLQQGKIFEELV